jgi:hypothetical protein
MDQGVPAARTRGTQWEKTGDAHWASPALSRNGNAVCPRADLQSPIPRLGSVSCSTFAERGPSANINCARHLAGVFVPASLREGWLFRL